MMHHNKIYTLAGVAVVLALLILGPAAAKKYDTGRAWIGVYTQSIDKDLQEAFDLDTGQGLVIVDVADNSPAEDAGLKRKDIIVELNGQKVEDADDLLDMVEDLDVGDKAEMKILRKGKEQTVDLTIGQKPKFEWFGSRSGSHTPRVITRDYHLYSDSEGYIGVGIQNLTEQLGDYFGVKDGAGVLITEVFEDSPAAKAGLKAGDLVVAVDGEDIAQADELQEIIADKKEGDQVSVEYLRHGNREKVTVEVAENSAGINRYSIPDINIQIPNLSLMKNLDHFYFSDDDNGYFNAEEYKQQMKELKKELQEMSKELKEIQKKLE